ncbi:hypothetical protein ABI59_03640 [Acidobacteria bacterium Mor1]|nr:hypothetical protein ABI59_03640 [Acidobacteria bacterium Mor1]
MSGGRALLIGLERNRYRIDAGAIDGLVPTASIVPVPRAPRGVLGLTEWRGRLLTVIDLPLILDERPNGDAACLVRLASPHASTALFVPGPVRLVDDTADVRQLETIDPVRLVEAIELRLRSRPFRGNRGVA